MSSLSSDNQKKVIQSEVHNNVRYNFLINVGDGTFFGFAIGVTSFTTILPLFVASFTDSAILIGLIPAMHVLGWQLPQIFTAQFVSSLKRLKPTILVISLQERLPFLGLAIIAYYSGSLSSKAVLLLVFAMLSWHGLAAGLAANPWQNLLVKVIPDDIRGMFFGIMNGSSNLFGSFGALLAGVLLENNPFPINFAICFFITFIAMLASYTCLALNREPQHKIDHLTSSTPISQRVLIKKIFSQDRKFVVFIFTRILFQFSMMALAFFTIYSVKELNVTTVSIGILTALLLVVQVVSNPILGWLADHWGKRNAFVLGALAALISAGLAAAAQQTWLLYPVFLFMGIANSTYWTIGMAYSLEFGSEKEKPTYIGLSNTLITPAVVLAPLLGGWLANIGGYRLTFLVSSIFALLTIIILLLLDKNSGITNSEQMV